MVGSAGIAAKKYSHVKYFPNSAAYDDYYDIAVDIGEVGVESFATRIQEMLVDYRVSPIVVMQVATTYGGGGLMASNQACMPKPG